MNGLNGMNGDTSCGCTVRSVRILHKDVVQCGSQRHTLCVLLCVPFVAGALRRIHAEALLPPPLCPTQWRSREDGRGGGGL